MGRKYKVIVAYKADSMLIDHVKFLAEINRESALNLIDAFNKAAESLKEFPERFSWLENSSLPDKKYRKMLVMGRYILIYQIKEDTVYIDHVLDGKSDYNFL